MPALAQKIAPEYHDDYSVQTAPAPTRPRWQEEEQATRKRPARKNRPSPDPEDIEQLLEHFGHGSGSARDPHLREEVENRRQQKRLARLRHRPFRLTVTATMLAAAPLCLLASLLWMRSNSMALARRDVSLQNQISAARFSMESTRQQIASLNASPHLESWAKARGWKRAGQQDFDQVPARTPITNDGEPMTGDGESSTP